MVTNEDRMRTLTVELTYLFDSEGNTQWGVVMAGTIFVLAPLISNMPSFFRLQLRIMLERWSYEDWYS